MLGSLSPLFLLFRVHLPFLPPSPRFSLCLSLALNGIDADAGGSLVPGTDIEVRYLVAAADAAPVAMASMEGPARPQRAGEGSPGRARAAAAAAQRPMPHRQGRVRCRPSRDPLLYGPL